VQQKEGLGGCMIGSINKKGLRKTLNLFDKYEILLVIALGKPKETVVIDNIEIAKDIKYWRDKNEIHHVPKRNLDDIIIG
jgi:nitroreductase